MIFDLENFKGQIGDNFKIIYDVFCSYLFHVIEGKDHQKNIDSLTTEQLNELIKWINSYAIPFYENLEDFEKCAKLKNTSNTLSEKRNIKKDLAL